MADFSTESLAKVQLKHPVEHKKGSFLPVMSSDSALLVHDEDVLHAIRSFLAGALEGPDVIRPQLLLEMVQSREVGPRLISVLTLFTNILLEGKCNMELDDLLFKLDFANEFNCLHRNAEHCQGGHSGDLLFSYSAYRYYSTLQFGSFSSFSQVNPRQGDPLAGLLFSLAIQ